MNITFELLLYYLRDLHPEIIKKPANKHGFVGVQQLELPVKPNYKQDEEEKEGQFLYITSLSALLSDAAAKTVGLAAASDLTLLVSADCKFTKKQLQEFACGLILVKEKFTVPYLINRLINLFYSLTEWDKTMHIAALEGQPIQKIVDLSENMLEHPLIIFDAGFDVLAYSKNRSTDYANFKGTTEHGYTDARTMDLVRQNNILFRLKKGEPLVAPAVEAENITNVYLSFYGDQNIIGYGCIFIEQKNVEPGYLDLVRIFSANLEFCLKRDYDNQRFGQMLYETFLLNLLNNIPMSEMQIAEQLKNVEGLSGQGHFVLGVIEFTDPSSTPIKFLAKQMAAAMWDVRPVIFGVQICLLRILKEDHKIEIFSEREKEELNRILDHYEYHLGVSNEFNRITDIRYAYHQACAALHFGRKKESRILRYEEYYFYDLLSLLETEMPAEFLRMGLYSQLKEYDQKHGSSYCELILTYIKCDCNASHTAERLYLHRNTIRNAVLFVEENWNVDLKDMDVKKMIIFGEEVDSYLDDVHFAQ